MAKKGFGSGNLVTFGLGVGAGIIIGQIFGNAIDPLYAQIPILGPLKVGHAYQY